MQIHQRPNKKKSLIYFRKVELGLAWVLYPKTVINHLVSSNALCVIKFRQCFSCLRDFPRISNFSAGFLVLAAKVASLSWGHCIPYQQQDMKTSIPFGLGKEIVWMTQADTEEYIQQNKWITRGISVFSWINALSCHESILHLISRQWVKAIAVSHSKQHCLTLPEAACQL